MKTSAPSTFDKIICVGKNYLDHALELGDAVPEDPVFFFKPPSALVESPVEPVLMPAKNRGSVHFECEIVYRIKVKEGAASLDAVTLGLDLTLRDLQAKLKKQGHPWEAAKAFPRSAITAKWIPCSEFKDHLKIPFELLVNGELRQKATGEQMRRSPRDLLSVAGQFFDLRDGDLFFTGTPKGVGAIAVNDTLTLRWGDRLFDEVRFI
jgi:2-keto-4-pentenoate hydratase/2-oxohepta-3-ene-1,7-dioic acid hydratase in catechol pathway